MTTGVPIYLVSACASGEEFISAFRRYADRNGVMFIPISEPLPPGRKGRFALALANGGVMIEGQAEVVSSARTPSVLYGRIGMTIKFLAPDEPSQTMLAELEKARTSLRPPAPSVAPRPAEIPAEPRPKPPAPGGRVDAVNALAECVIIGDVSTLSRDSDLSTIPPPIGSRQPSGSVPVVVAKQPSGSVPVVVAKQPSGSVPVVVAKQPSGPVPVVVAKQPSGPVPVVVAKQPSGAAELPKQPSGAVATELPKQPSGAVAAAIAKQPSGAVAAPLMKPPASTMPPPFKPATRPGGVPIVPMPPSETARAKAPSIPPTIPAIPAAPGVIGKSTLALPALDRRPAAPSGELAVPRTSTTQGVGPQKPLDIAPPPPVQSGPVVPQSREEAVAAALKFAQAVEARASVGGTVKGVMPTAMDTIASGPPSAVRAIVEPILEIDEPTDMTDIPPGEPPRRTEIGVAVTPSGALVLPSAPPRPSDAETRDTSQLAAEEPTNPLDVGLVPVEQAVDPLASTQAAMRVSKIGPTIEEPSGDWSMSTQDGSLTITPRKPLPEDEKPTEEMTPLAKGPPTGDWIVALDPSRPDGWSEPSKVEKRPAGELPGPPVSTVASDKPLDSEARAQPTIATDEPKIQIDPTLIEPLTPLPATDGEVAAASAPALPRAASPMTTTPGMAPVVVARAQSPMPGPIPNSFVTPPVGTPQLANASGSVPAISAGFTPSPRQLTDGGVGFFRDSGDIQHLPDDGTLHEADEAAKKKRMAVIIASAALVLVVGIVLLFVLGGEDKKSDPSTPPPAAKTEIKPSQTAPVAQPPPPPADAAVVAPAPGAPEQVAVVEPDKQPEEKPAPPPPADCTFKVTSVPSAAELTIGDNAKGPTPVTVTVPCGVSVKLTLKKARFQTTTREVAPKPATKNLKITLPRTTFTVKVSSSPPGATVTLNGKNLGVTPTMVKLPAFEASTVKFSKDGYGAETSKFTPKNNAGSINVTLKKTAGKATKKR